MKLNFKIKSLEKIVEELKAQKIKMTIADKKIKGDLANLKCTNKVLSTRLVATETKVEELKEQLKFEVASVKEVSAKCLLLEKKVSSVAKARINDSVKLMPTLLKARLKKATKQVDLWVLENKNIEDIKLKLERQVETLKSRNEVLRSKYA